MKADPCGHCLILNNVNFSRDSGLSTREGSDIDCEKLERRFRALHFTVLTRRNLNAQVGEAGCVLLTPGMRGEPLEATGIL